MSRCFLPRAWACHQSQVVKLEAQLGSHMTRPSGCPQWGPSPASCFFPLPPLPWAPGATSTGLGRCIWSVCNCWLCNTRWLSQQWAGAGPAPVSFFRIKGLDSTFTYSLTNIYWATTKRAPWLKSTSFTDRLPGLSGTSSTCEPWDLGELLTPSVWLSSLVKRYRNSSYLVRFEEGHLK